MSQVINTRAHLKVRSSKSSAHDVEPTPFPQLDDDISTLHLLPSPPLSLRSVPEETFGEEEDVCRDDIKDMRF